jgi:hypothetical protein
MVVFPEPFLAIRLFLVFINTKEMFSNKVLSPKDLDMFSTEGNSESNFFAKV